MNILSSLPPQLFRNLILYSIPLVVLSLIGIATDFNGLFGQDANEYLRMVRDIRYSLTSHEALQQTIFPVLYPFVSFLIGDLIGNDLLALQLVSILSLSASFFLLTKILQMLYPEAKNAEVFTLIVFFLSPYVLRFGLISMSDMFCMMWLLAAVFFFLNHQFRGFTDDAVFAAFCLMLSAATRYAAIVIVAPLFIALLFSLGKNKNWLGMIGALAIAVIPLLPDLFLRNHLLFFDLSANLWSIDYSRDSFNWSLRHFFQNTFQNADGSQHYYQWNIIYGFFNFFHPAFLFLGIVLFFFVRRTDIKIKGIIWLMIAVLSYAFFIAGIPYQSKRYLLLNFPVILIFLFPAFDRMIKKFFHRKIFRLAFLIAMAIVQIGLFFYSSHTIYEMNQSEKEIAATLKTFPDAIVYTCTINGALNSYEVENSVTDILRQTIVQPEPNSLLLFNYPEFSSHFQKMLPMENWKFLNENYQLLPIDSFDAGWKLYQINTLR